MITLTQIGDLFLRDFSGGDQSKDSQLDRRDVIKRARYFANAVLKPIYFEKLSEGDRSAIAQAIYSYELSATKDSTGQYYLSIPDSFMALVHNRGVHRIYPKGNPFRDFVIQHNPGISSNLPHMKLAGVQYCYIEGLKVWFGKGCVANKADKFILQIINVAPDAIADTDPLPIMPEQVGEIMRLLKMDYAPVASIPNDYLNNQNANT